MKICLLIFITFISVLNCTIVDRDIKLSDNDVIVTERYFSPDSSKAIYTYHLDIGALGFSRSWNALLDASDTLGVLNKNLIPDLPDPINSKYYPVGWIDKNIFLLEVKPRPFIKENIPIDTTSFYLDGTEFKVQVEKLSALPHIEHYALSPNGKKLLVAYRYSGVSKLEISIIERNATLPKFGNIYTNYEYSENPILFGRWITNNSIQLDLNANSYTLDFFRLNKNLNGIDIEINKIDYQRKYSSILGGWYNKNLFPVQDSSKNFRTTSEIKGIISPGYAMGDTYYTGLINQSYQYEYDGKILKSYFRVHKDSTSFEIGDEILLEVDINQPIIHRVLGKVSR